MQNLERLHQVCEVAHSFSLFLSEFVLESGSEFGETQNHAQAGFN